MNHLFIGLGGTGGNVIKSFRKLYHQHFGNEQADGIGIDYLWVDSDPDSFKADRPDWERHGESLHLKPDNQLCIHHADVKSVVANLQDEPRLQAWFGPTKPWQQVLESLSSEGTSKDTCGQKRRIGRLLFALQVDEFNKKVATLSRRIQARTGSDEITFHVISSLTGGMGSGAIVDVIAQLRNNFPYKLSEDSTHRIVAYTYLPEVNTPTDWDKGNYYVNAYAALLELNAMSVGSWSPIDIATGRQFSKGLACAFNGCYVFTDYNSKGYSIAISKDLSKVVADFIYNKVVSIRHSGWENLNQAENCSNGDCRAELEFSEPVRSLRFMNFGINRIQFPQERLFESLGYEYQVQALEHLRFDNWQEGHGFTNMRRLFCSVAYITDNDLQEKWQLTGAHLLLEKPIIDSDVCLNWKAHDVTWMALCNHYVALIKGSKIATGLSEIYRLLNYGFEEHYREGSGVKDYFEHAERNIDIYATHIVTHIEQDIIRDWRTDRHSMSECLDIVTTLLQQLETKLTEATATIGKKRLLAERYKQAYEDLQTEWLSAGLLTKATGNKDNYIPRAGGYLREHFYALTYVHAYEYQKKLLQALIQQLTKLQNDIEKGYLIIRNSVHLSKKAIASRVISNTYGNRYIDTLEDPLLQKKVRKKLISDQAIQQQHVKKAKRRIFASLGATLTFEHFVNQKLGISKMLLQHCFESVRRDHDRYLNEQDEHIFKVCIIDKLYKRYGDDQTNIDNQGRNLIRDTGYFAEISSQQLNLDFESGISDNSGNIGLNNTSIIMPMPDEHAAFIERLKRAFRHNFEGDTLDFIEACDNTNAISVLTMTNLLPIRAIDLVARLKEQYDARIKLDPVQTALEVHIEGDGSNLPDLFVINKERIKTLKKPLLLLALSSGILVEQCDNTDKKPCIVHLKQNYHGIDMAPVEWSNGLLDIINNITDAQIVVLKQSIKHEILPNLPYAQSKLDRLKLDLQTILIKIRKQIKTSSSVESEALMAEWITAANQVIRFAKGERVL